MPVRLCNVKWDAVFKTSDIMSLTTLMMMDIFCMMVLPFLKAREFVCLRKVSRRTKALLNAASRALLSTGLCKITRSYNEQLLGQLSAAELFKMDMSRNALEAFLRIQDNEKYIRESLQSLKLLHENLENWLLVKMKVSSHHMLLYLACFNDSLRVMRFDEATPPKHYLYYLIGMMSARHLARWAAEVVQRPQFPRWNGRLRSDAKYTLPLPNIHGSECYHHSSGYCLTKWPLREFHFQRQLEEGTRSKHFFQLCTLYRGRPYCLGCAAYWW